MKPTLSRIWHDARHVGRPVALSAIAIAVITAILLVNAGPDTAPELVCAIVALAAITILQVHQALRGLHRRSSNADAAAAEAEKHYVDVLGRIVSLVEDRDRYSRGHSTRVGKLGRQLGQRLGLDESTCEQLDIAGQLHDIGMFAIPAKVLAQPSKMSVAEFQAMQQHTTIAEEMLRPLKMLEPVLPAVKGHHERMNGTGYPDGLKAQDIPIVARILAVADAYDAMTHDRPHRPAMSAAVAWQELLRCTPAGYDVQCVQALGQMLNLPNVNQAASSTQVAST